MTISGDYVRMTIDYTSTGTVLVIFSIFLDYLVLEDIIQGLSVNLQGMAVTPAAEHVFKSK